MSLLDADIRGRDAIADWIETTLLTRGTRQLGADALLSLAHDEIEAGIPQVNLALGVMKRRSAALGSAYPFDVRDVAVRALPSAAEAPYAALVLMSSDGVVRQTIHRVPNEAMVVLFEEITEAAGAHLWGEHGHAVRFGWPSHHGRPAEFPDGVEWLAERLGIRVGSGYRPPRRKDGGVDVVAWRPFPDRRSGFPLVLIQCTVQADLASKASDIDVRLWSTWLALDFEPMTAVATPQIVQPGPVWDQLALRCMVLERVRLAGLIPAERHIRGLAEWTGATCALVAPLLGGAEA